MPGERLIYLSPSATLVGLRQATSRLQNGSNRSDLQVGGMAGNALTGIRLFMCRA